MKPKSPPASARKTAVRVGSQKQASEPAATSFPIVGLGASAGGLEALGEFLKHVPTASGMAYVIVQHLDPTHKGIMPELLQRATEMKVSQVRDRTRIRPNCVYVIPPNKDMSILRGVLHLLAPAEPRGLRLPIDFFFRSLAQDQRGRSIGVILSGMGSDGNLGLRAIKEEGGITLVQDPATAKFDGMPRSAVDAGLADVVAPAEALPERIISFRRHIKFRPKKEAISEEGMQGSLEKAVILLRAHNGQDFSLYKRNTLYRRIERRMGIHQITKISAYVRYLQENSQELDLLFKELLIGVTSFFRDPAVWKYLRDEIIPALLAGRRSGSTLRAWVPGCSTGEEAYSLAIIFKEVMEKAGLKGKFTLQIFATDLDGDAIDKARQGVFPASIGSDVSPQRLERFFEKEESGFRLRKEIREMVVFARQNLIMDPPFTRLDILSCRNLLIYLAPEIQKKLFPLFSYSLTPGGILLLGSSETVGDFSNLFTTVNSRSRIFRRSEVSLLSGSPDFPSFFAGSVGHREVGQTPKLPPSLQSLADQLILQRYAPSAVLANEKGDILYISGRTGKYLEPAAGKANWNIFAMAREGLRYELATAFQKALHQEGEVRLEGLKISADGGEHFADITLQRLENTEPLRGLIMILFADASRPPETSLRKQRTSPLRLSTQELHLQQTRQELQRSREEMQRSQEELRSANEELQSTNEELQSTNEELTTSKEEMQSLNEELQTVNSELQTKVDELSRSNNDMKNLLNSTDIATVFLGRNLQVRRFTTQATKIIRLIPSDIGRPITDLASNLDYPSLVKDVREVLRTLSTVEKPAATKDGRWFNVRIMPYRTLDDHIDGVVITFSDITAAKTLEAELRSMQAGLEKRVADQSAKMKQTRKRAGKTAGEDDA